MRFKERRNVCKEHRFIAALTVDRECITALDIDAHAVALLFRRVGVYEIDRSAGSGFDSPARIVQVGDGKVVYTRLQFIFSALPLVPAPQMLCEDDRRERISLFAIDENGERFIWRGGNARRLPIRAHPNHFQRILCVLRHVAHAPYFGVFSARGKFARLFEERFAVDDCLRPVCKERKATVQSIRGRAFHFLHDARRFIGGYAAHELRIAVIGEQIAQPRRRFAFRFQKNKFGCACVFCCDVAVYVGKFKPYAFARHRLRQSKEDFCARFRRYRNACLCKIFTRIVGRGVYGKRARIAALFIIVLPRCIYDALDLRLFVESDSKTVGKILRVGRVCFPKGGKFPVERVCGVVPGITAAVRFIVRYCGTAVCRAGISGKVIFAQNGVVVRKRAHGNIALRRCGQRKRGDCRRSAKHQKQ